MQRLAALVKRFHPLDKNPKITALNSRFADSSREPCISRSEVPVRRQRQQSLAKHRRRPADPPTHPAAERQVPRYSGQPPAGLANVRFRRAPTLDSKI